MQNVHCHYCQKYLKQSSFQNHLNTVCHKRNIIRAQPLCTKCNKKTMENRPRELFNNDVMCERCFDERYKEYQLEQQPPCIICNEKTMENQVRDLDNRIYCDRCYEEEKVTLLSRSNKKMAEIILELQEKVNKLVDRVGEIEETIEDLDYTKIKVEELEKDLDRKVDKEYYDPYY